MLSALVFVGGVNRGIGYVARPAGEGIAAFRLDLASGEAEPLALTKGIDNPTFVAVAPNGQSLVAVSEVDGWHEGLITAYGLDRAAGALRYRNKQPTRGDYTCFAGFDRSGRFAGIANYGGVPVTEEPNRSFAIFPVRADGSLGAPCAEITHTGQGKDPDRQGRPHAHCLRWSPDNRFILVADLGIDRLMIYRFDAQSGAVLAHGAAELAPGAGPRHLQFHPSLPLVYCVNELDSTLATLRFDPEAGQLELLGAVSTLPSGGHPGNSCSAIAVHPSGQHIFVGNRGHDSVARFVLETQTGLPTLLGTTPAGGHIPRDLALDPSGTLLAVANQESDRVSLFRYEPQSGGLEPLDASIDVGSPTVVAFHPELGGAA